jgi:hypothetical protein
MRDAKKSITGTAIGPGSSTATLIKTKRGKSAALKNISLAARRIILRRREGDDTRVSSARLTSMPPASHSANPLSASPHREQNLISSETCC